ncbi:DUF551 domain-containing protein [Escherichia albertii]|nr:DUF551 domain-containing protein [Escherichia albertii]MCQ8985702.1 DUF551 domain-containing protein [Escherichia albertii]MCQ9017061.1 DUF551 domain-containing protein [Escherichia albertii]UUL41310.1 DUF551 domain-containing protein [Escherichia albertii]WDB56438.1 DUF551 domain-containing protein [Escherichia albertii]HEB1227684.1 DUF551 domain-containing protein [Escherichia albertii]
MTTITKERLLTIKQWRETYGPGSNVVLPAEEAEELARIALASLEAEPVAYIFKHPAGKLFWALTDESNKDQSDVIPVYAAPPVPVVPAALPENDDEDGHDIDYLDPSEVYALGRTAGWNACRAAMLHGAEPASNHEELPLDYLQGQKDGLEWAAQLAEANHPQTGDWLYDDPLELAKAIRKGPDMPEFDGPTPVTPDSWISCSERIPAQDDWVLIYSKHGEYMAGQVQGEYVELSDGTLSWLGNALFWMPLPEPPQEMK